MRRGRCFHTIYFFTLFRASSIKFKVSPSTSRGVMGETIFTLMYGFPLALSVTRFLSVEVNAAICAMSAEFFRLNPGLYSSRQSSRCLTSLMPRPEARLRSSATSIRPLTLSGGSPKRSISSSVTSSASSRVRISAMRR